MNPAFEADVTPARKLVAALGTWLGAPLRVLLGAWLAALLALFALTPALAQQPVPALSARVIDQTGTLTAAQHAALETKLAAFEAQAGPQIVVLLVASTAPEDIAAYAQRVADSWKIGRRDQGDGVLVVVAKGERRVRIEVAKALEGAIPDLAARQIIDNAIRPAFRADDYAGGLNAALDQLMGRIRGEGLPAPAAPVPAREGALPGLQLEELAMFSFIAVPIIATVLTSLFGRKLGSLLTAGGAGYAAWWFSASVLVAVGVGLAALVLVGIIGFGAAGRRMARRGGRIGPTLPHVGGWDGGGWGGSGGGFGGGGGFSSGGGGDFGGGGASGDW